MKPFHYERAQDIASAIALVAQSPGAAFFAGGTNLVDLMKLGVTAPETLIDIRRLTSEQIEELPDGGLRIGAAMPNSALAAERDTVLEQGELIIAIDIPAMPYAANSRDRKVRDRASYAFALLSVAAALDVVDGVVLDVRIAPLPPRFG